MPPAAPAAPEKSLPAPALDGFGVKVMVRIEVSRGTACWLSYGLLFIAGALLPSQSTKVYTSPDHALQAVVTTNATGEFQVELRTSQGRVLLRQDDRSEDGEHGGGIVHAAWTADSQFFVASIVASGGHQPWARPLRVYSRARNRVLELSALGVNATGDFTLRPPDIVETTVLCPNRDQPVKFGLHRLVLAGRLQTDPCNARSSRR